MKTFIVVAIAAGACVIGGVAKADVIDSVGNTISRVFGVPYNPVPDGAVPVANGLYTDASGRHFQVDAAGHYVPIDRYGSYRDRWGHTVYLAANRQPAWVEANGQLMPYGGAAGPYAVGAPYDRDHDGVANRYDRYPDDPRYR